MTIISISIDDKLLAEADRLQKSIGHSGRSDLIRSALQGYLAEERQRSKKAGHVDGVITIINDEKSNAELMNLWHEHQHLIHSHIHNHLHEHACLQVLTVHGDAKAIHALGHQLSKNRRLRYVKLILI